MASVAVILNDPSHDSCLSSFQVFLLENPQYVNADAINVYVPNATDGFSGYGSYGNLNIVLNSYSMEDDNFWFRNHEMGHVFGLPHTFAGWTSPEPYCEHVTRDITDLDDPNDPYDTYYNANIRGDAVHETAAAPDFRNELCEELGFPYPYTDCTAEKYHYISDAPSCTYSNPEGKDCQNTQYEIYQSDVRNLMAYTYSLCGQELTIDQGAKMRVRIEDNPGKFNPITNILGIASLYEPYRGEYYFAGPLPEHYTPLFQPGFDYTFLECCCNYPQPTPYEIITFSYTNNVLLSVSKYEEDYSSITHPNHSAIDLGANLPTLQTVRKCYDNYNRAPIGGSITKFNDNILNANVTITPKDSVGINNQSLITDLPEGLYKIEKNYPDGAIQETVIFKENN